MYVIDTDKLKIKIVFKLMYLLFCNGSFKLILLYVEISIRLKQKLLNYCI